MSHNEATEIRLINKIVVHFAYLPPEQAVTEVANHVSRFWDPRMKRRLFELVDSPLASDVYSVARAYCKANQFPAAKLAAQVSALRDRLHGPGDPRPHDGRWD